jgi:hypothetical protein
MTLNSVVHETESVAGGPVLDRTLRGSSPNSTPATRTQVQTETWLFLILSSRSLFLGSSLPDLSFNIPQLNFDEGALLGREQAFESLPQDCGAAFE